VADQGVEHEHLVQDAGSDDGTLDWLLGDERVKAFVEKDSGMYDAVNRGLRRSTGDILCQLNCDEQYLPGALRAVADLFESHPEVEVVFGDFVVTNEAGEYLFHRKVQTPLLHHLWVSHLPTFTCGIFYRRKIIDKYQAFFDPNLRDVGDGKWMLGLLQRRVPMAVLRRFTSVFAMTGANMSRGENARREARELARTAPQWARNLKWLLVLQHRLRRLAGGIYAQAPFSYSLYQREGRERVTHQVTHPVSRWKAP
jgi:glycosyltransferase involved in cell wall biosynthesis